MNLDLVFGQETQPLEDVARFRIAQGSRAHVRLGGLDGNVQRRKPLLHNSIPIAGEQGWSA